MSFVKRHQFYLVGFIIAAALIAYLYMMAHSTLRSTSYMTGWVLFLVLLFLAGYNGRKKLPFLPLGSSASWLKFHLYGGWIAVFLFGLHLYPHWPRTIFGSVLAVLFVITALSGIVGIFLSRNLALRLSTRGSEVIYERIPAIRRELKEKAEALVFQSVEETNAQTIAQFYTQKLEGFFSGPHHFLHHLFEVNSAWARLQVEIKSLERYLNEKEMEIYEKLKLLVKSKEDLDYHFALQSTLKYWLFIHIPFTFALLLFVLVHIILMQAFIG